VTPAPGAGTSPVRIDTSVAHIARVQDYWLGGRDNFAADRRAGEEAGTAFPGLVASVRSTRAFLAHTVRYLTADEGIRQFLDIGTGIPTAGYTHSVAQAIAPEALVVYMDNDPVVFAHARGLLSSGPHGSTAYLDTDLRDAGKVLAEAARMLDLTQPVALVLSFVPLARASRLS
jgi:S-adenosyl methyltransferase